MCSHRNRISLPVLAILLALAIGAVLGLINGLLVAYAKVPSIIVTLGTMAIYRAVLTEIAGGSTIVTNDLPDWLVDLPRSSIGGWGGFDLRTMFIVALAAALVLQLVLARLRGGRILYAVGSNPDAARQAGLPQALTVLVAFTVCGALAGLAGFMFLGQFGTVNVTAGAGFELAAVAAAVVGGVSIQGGSGTVIGALLGAILIEILDLSLVRVPQVSEFWRDAILGVLIVGCRHPRRGRQQAVSPASGGADRSAQVRCCACVTGSCNGRGTRCSARSCSPRSSSTSPSPTGT